jgi:hypothetical protein
MVGRTVASPLANGVVTGAAASNRATVEQGTLSHEFDGVRHEVSLLSNAKEVAEATARGASIQGMTCIRVTGVFHDEESKKYDCFYTIESNLWPQYEMLVSHGADVLTTMLRRHLIAA